MTNLLLRFFIKNYDRTEEPSVRSSVGKLAGATGIVCNVLLCIGKLIAGILSGSVSVIADAVNNLTDAGSSIVTLLGFRLAQQPADHDHPYGHARYEYLAGLAVAGLILMIGVELAGSSIGKILHPTPVDYSVLTIGILLGSILVKFWMAGFYRKLAKHIASTALRASAADSRNDVVATGAVLLGIMLGRFFRLNLDGFIGFGVALFILYSGVSVARDTISPLLGQQADAALMEKLSRLVLSHDKILGIHDLLIHDYGPGRCYASVHAELSAHEDPVACHEIIDDIECDALAELNVHLVIHYDPVTVDDDEWKQMRTLIGEIISRIDSRLSMHDFRMVRGARQNKLVFDVTVPYDMEISKDSVKQRIDEALHTAGLTYETLVHFDGKE